MLFDTDVLIWVQRGNSKAAKAIETAPRRRISILTQMELMQGVRDTREAQVIRSFLADFDFRVIPLSESIGHRAAVYVELLALGHGIRTNDAIIAATAIEAAEPLCTSNVKHFRLVPGLELSALKI